MDSKIKPRRAAAKENTTTRLHALVRESPMGIESGAAAKILGVAAKTVCDCAQRLARAHEVAIFRRRFASLIVPASNAQAAREMLQEQRLRMAEEKRAARSERERVSYRRAWERHEDWAESEPIHRVVRAEQAKPLAKRGPASVWELSA